MRRSVFLLLFAGIFVAAGCSSKSPAPTSPSASSTPSASVPIDLSTTTPVGTEGVSTGAGVMRPIVGIVEKLDGTCPARSFVLAGIKVLVTDRTAYESGTCADLVDGIRVGAIGIRKDDHTIQATRVKIAPPLPPLPPPVAGEVTSVSGTCPTLTFVVRGVTVRTTGSTDFDGGECTDVQVGVRLAAAGHHADGALIAEHVKIPPPLTTVQGIVSALGGTCPRVSFALLDPGSRAGTIVLTSERTRFEGGNCSDLRDGLRAGAVGLVNPRGALEARGVKIAVPR